MTRPRLAIALALCATTDALAAPVSRPIIDGVPAESEQAVVALADDFGSVYCSGTLISPRVVLTAAHCLGRRPAFVFIGSDSSRDGVFLTVAGAMAHPETRGIAGTDIALVWLERPTPIPPPRILATPLIGAEVGAELRLVGFGSTGIGDTGTYGIKHAGTTTLDGVDDQWIRYGVVGCHGDSGGPAFLVHDGGDVLAGVTSHGDSACRAGGFSARVDLVADWILASVAAIDPASCRLDGRCVAACGTDLDCEMDPPGRDVDESTGGCATTRSSSLALSLALAALLRRRRKVGP